MKKTFSIITVILALSFVNDSLPTKRVAWSSPENIQSDHVIIASCCVTGNASDANNIGEQMECEYAMNCAKSKSANPTITWSIKDAGTTGAIISGDTLYTAATGTVTITAKVVNSTAIGDFTQDFYINVQTSDIIIVRTAADLDAVRNGPGKHYRLGNDIDLNEYLAPGGSGFAKWSTSGWMPISGFTGVLDGNGHKITGLWADRCLMDNVGLFGNTINATIMNIGVEIVAAGILGHSYVGGLVGEQYSSNNGSSKIVNCYTTGNVSGYKYVGGLVGGQRGNNSSNTIENSYATGNVSGGLAGIGGIAGIQYAQGASNNIIKNCYATGNIFSIRQAGGLVGFQLTQNTNNKNTITNCYATGNVTAISDGTGGLAGLQEVAGIGNTNIIENSFSTGNVSSYSYSGGLVGEHRNNNTIINSYRYQYVKVNGVVRSGDTPGGPQGGIVTSSELETKATYTSNSWLFNDSVPTAGPWHWDIRGFPKLNMGDESRPWPW